MSECKACKSRGVRCTFSVHRNDERYSATQQMGVFQQPQKNPFCGSMPERVHECFFIFPTPALSVSGYMGIISDFPKKPPRISFIIYQDKSALSTEIILCPDSFKQNCRKISLSRIGENDDDCFSGKFGKRRQTDGRGSSGAAGNADEDSFLTR